MDDIIQYNKDSNDYIKEMDRRTTPNPENKRAEEVAFLQKKKTIMNYEIAKLNVSKTKFKNDELAERENKVILIKQNSKSMSRFEDELPESLKVRDELNTASKPKRLFSTQDLTEYTDLLQKMEEDHNSLTDLDLQISMYDHHWSSYIPLHEIQEVGEEFEEENSQDQSFSVDENKVNKKMGERLRRVGLLMAGAEDEQKKDLEPNSNLSLSSLSSSLESSTETIGDTEKTSASFINFSRIHEANGKRCRCVIHPSNIVKRTWDKIILVLLIYVVVVLPFKFSFIVEVHEYWDYFDSWVDLAFFFDIILTFFSAYEAEDESGLVYNHLKIALHYVKFWFWVDLVSIFPFEAVFDFSDFLVLTKASRLPRLYKITKVSKMLRTFKTVRKMEGEEKLKVVSSIFLHYPGAERVLINLLSICLVCHIFACAWHFVAFIDPQNDNWIWASGMIFKGVTDRYMTSIYWVAQTLTTVGYGDITPNNYIEQLISICTMLAGVVSFSLTIGTLTSLIADIDAKNSSYEKKLGVLLNIQRNTPLSKKLFDQVNLMLKFGVYKRDETFEEFLSYLPNSIMIELSNVIYGQMVQGLNFFEFLFIEEKEEFIALLGPCLRIINYAKDEIIFNASEYSREMYFIRKGEIAGIIPECNNIPFIKIIKGDYFGEIDLMFQSLRKFTMKAFTDVELLAVDEDNFRRIFLGEFREIGNTMRKRAEKRRMTQIKNFNEVKAKFKMHKYRRDQQRRRSLITVEDSISMVKDVHYV